MKMYRSTRAFLWLRCLVSGEKCIACGEMNTRGEGILCKECEDELKRSRRIAMVWVVISLAVAVFIGIVGRALYPTTHLTSPDAENILLRTRLAIIEPVFSGKFFSKNV